MNDRHQPHHWRTAFLTEPGFLDVFPEFEGLRGKVEQNDWHNDSPDQQSLRLAQWIEQLPTVLGGAYSGYQNLISTLLASYLERQNGRYPLQSLLAFAALIHDIGKAKTYAQQPDGTTRCPGHEAVGARMAPAICARFDFTAAETEFITSLIAYHGEPYGLFKRMSGLQPDEQAAAVAQFEVQHGRYLRPLLLLAYGDMITSHLQTINPTKFEAVSAFYQNWLEALFQRDEKLLTLAQKNQVASYGLTLVAGLPLPHELLNQIGQIQGQLEAAAPNCFTWYQPFHLHITLYAPLRSRQLASPPLSLSQLPPDLDDFVATLNHCANALAPFRINLVNIHLTPVGHIIIRIEGATAVKAHLIKTLTPFLGADAPKDRPDRIHGTIGYLHKLPSDVERVRLQKTLAQINQIEIGHMLVEQIWLVHYAHRTLRAIVGKMPLVLSQANSITTSSLLQALTIRQTAD